MKSSCSSPGLGIPGNHLGRHSEQRICCPQMVALAVPPLQSSAMDEVLIKVSQILGCSPSIEKVEEMMNEVSQILANLKMAAAAADDPAVAPEEVR
eukprot:3786312-Karenia_brevis.AAC.1